MSQKVTIIQDTMARALRVRIGEAEVKVLSVNIAPGLGKTNMMIMIEDIEVAYELDADAKTVQPGIPGSV